MFRNTLLANVVLLYCYVLSVKLMVIWW